MTYKRFEDLPVWKEAMRLAHRVFDLTENSNFKIGFSLRNQIERSVMSISDNIAEGFERGTTSELLAFLYISRGSAGETRSKLAFMADRPRLANFKSEISNLKLLAESCSRQLRAWAESLQDSNIKGPRHLNTRVREQEAARKRAEVLRKTLLGNLPATHPLVRDARERGSEVATNFNRQRAKSLILAQQMLALAPALMSRAHYKFFQFREGPTTGRQFVRQFA